MRVIGEEHESVDDIGDHLIRSVDARVLSNSEPDVIEI